MPRIAVAFLFATLVAASANAQIVVESPTIGGIVRQHHRTWTTSTWVTTSGSTSSTWWLTTVTNTMTRQCVVGNLSTATSWSTSQGIVEFNLSGLPTVNMTTNNFTAKINSLSASGVYSSGTMPVALYDLADAREDNFVTTSDYDQYLGSPIASSTFVPAGTMPDFDDVDVTEVLKRDLFGDGTAGTSSGFLLRSTSGLGQVDYQSSSPKLVITVIPTLMDAGTDAGTDTDTDSDADAGTDTDSDADADTDSDADADTDSDADADTDSDADSDADAGASGSDDSGCGCSHLGAHGGTSLLGTLAALLR